MPPDVSRLRSGRLGLPLALFAISMVLFATRPGFLTVPNLVNLVRQISISGILAVGVTFVLLTGGVDLSLGSLVALTEEWSPPRLLIQAKSRPLYRCLWGR